MTSKKVKKSSTKPKAPPPPPVVPQAKLLPFYAPEFTWETFEGFFCDFLAAQPKITDKHGKTVQVASANLYGRRGDSQHGIDIEAKMSNGEVWAFQCKHYQNWGPQKTKDAIKDCTYQATRKFLLVTRSVGSDVRDEINKHADWEVWDADDISREFLKLPRDVAARLLYSNFGPGWPERMLDMPGSSPLISAEAKFAPLLLPDRNFHHRLPLIGRKSWLATLDAFLDNQQARVLLLRGKGGLGKSRLLWEWSQKFSKKHKGWALKFIVESTTDIGAALDSTTRPMVLIFDDAHRFDEVRRKLFAGLVPRSDVKLVLSLRPGPTDQVMLELIEAGFDDRQIQKPEELKKLSSQEALQLAEAALGEKLALEHGLQLRRLSRDCPLLAVLAAELLRNGELSGRDFTNTDDFKNRVFNGMLREAHVAQTKFGETRTNDFLRLLALIAPVRTDTEFFKAAAALLGGDTKPNHVSDLLTALDGAGLLLKTGAGVRITPDLLSDHLAYTACYDAAGQNTTFAERVLEHFSPARFPQLLQHLAEAEWRALQNNDCADSIVEPVWQWFTKRFEASSFSERRGLIEQWANIAHLQPRRTLELAEAALQQTEAPPETNVWALKGWGDSHADVLAVIPSLLKPLAEHHPKYVAPCLDILWALGKNRTAAAGSRTKDHPITMIGEIAKFQKWKSIKIQREVLTWAEKLFRHLDWTKIVVRPAWVLRQILEPFFGLSVDVNWLSGNQFYWRSLPIDLDRTDEVRDRALKICSSLLAKKSVPLSLATLEILQHAIGPLQIPQYRPSTDAVARWRTEQLKALKIIASAVTEHKAPVIRHRLRKILLKKLRYESSEFREDCRKVFETLQEDLDSRVLRVALGSYNDEFERPVGRRPQGWQKEAKQRWTQFVHETATALSAKYPDPHALLEHVARQQNELVALGSNPNFREIFSDIARFHPERGLELAGKLLTERAHPLGWTFGALVSLSTPTKHDERLRLCEEALSTGDEDLTIGAIDCLVIWRHEGALPVRAWEMIADKTQNASERVTAAVLRFVEFADGPVLDVDWQLLSGLLAGQPTLAIIYGVLRCSATLLHRGGTPTSQTADKLLAALNHVPSLAAHDVEQALRGIGGKYPGKILLLFSRRLQLTKNGAADLEAFPRDFSSVRLGNIMSDPEAASFIRELEQKLMEGVGLDDQETQILRLAVLQDGVDTEAHLLRWLKPITTEAGLEHLADFVQEGSKMGKPESVTVRIIDGVPTLVGAVPWPIVLKFPDFVRALLEAARRAGETCHQEISQTIASLPLMRSFVGGGPAEEWTISVDRIAKLAKKYADDAELGELYAVIEKQEREWINRMRKNGGILADFLVDEE